MMLPRTAGLVTAGVHGKFSAFQSSVCGLRSAGVCSFVDRRLETADRSLDDGPFLPKSRWLWYIRRSRVLDECGNNSVVECDLAKVEVAGSNPVSRSNLRSHQSLGELRLAGQPSLLEVQARIALTRSSSPQVRSAP